jgi:hypothetical protein
MNDYNISEHHHMYSKRRSNAIFSLRAILYFFAWLCMWQGWHVSGSIFQLNFLGALFPQSALYLQEVVLIFTFILLFIERLLSGDLYFSRSYYSGPMLLMGFALVLSWTLGMYMRQQFTIVYELHESILIPISFFILINIFRSASERKILLVLFFFATIMKAADSVYIKFFSDDMGKGWGTVLFWRDGFLLCMGVVAMLIIIQYRGQQFKWLRKTMLFLGPFIMYGLIVSFRRTFILALIVSACAMIVTVGKGRRKKQLLIFSGFIIATIFFILITDPIGFMGRFFGALIMPTEEGSSYIRLMEYPNILMNIYHHPIFGVPISIEWFQYYRMPMYANFTTIGCHNSYLYWPLRTGIVGSFAFLWFLARAWKAILINIRIQKTEEDFLMNQLLLHSMIVYNFSCFFGLMYADAMNIMTGFILVMIQLQVTHASGLISYRTVNFWKTWTEKRIVIREKPGLLITQN